MDVVHHEISGAQWHWSSRDFSADSDNRTVEHFTHASQSVGSSATRRGRVCVLNPLSKDRLN
jgi:hypothetical protein